MGDPERGIVSQPIVTRGTQLLLDQVARINRQLQVRARILNRLQESYQIIKGDAGNLVVGDNALPLSWLDDIKEGFGLGGHVPRPKEMIGGDREIRIHGLIPEGGIIRVPKGSL